MITLSRRSGISIPRAYEDEPFYQNIKSFLTRHSRNYNDGAITINTFYGESDKYLLIPRFFPLDDYIDDYVIEERGNTGEDIVINHNIVPRTQLQKNTIDYMMKNNNGIIQLDPGSGKTVISIYVVAERKKKTFILVHRDSLADQWQGPGTPDKPQGFLAFTDLEKDDVARLTSANYEEALKNPVIICTDQTFISLLRRDRIRFLTALHKANIGIFIADEVHTTVGAPTFAECSIHISAPIVFGLSATPYRYDGNSDVITYHLGEIFTDDSDPNTMKADVIGILFNSGVVINGQSNMYVYWAGKFQKGRYLKKLRNSKIFNKVIKSLLLKVTNEDRDVICVIERLKFIDQLFSWLSVDSKSKFTSSAKNDQLEYKVVFATPGKIRDGVDIPKKDCLIMTSPVSNIAQMAGRIVRTSKDKRTPIIIDIIDITCKDICRSFINRLNYYKSKNWNVKYLYIDNNEEKYFIDEIAVMNLIANSYDYYEVRRSE